MSVSTCRPCRVLLRARLHNKIANLEHHRRGLQLSTSITAPRKGAHITSLYNDTVPPTTTQFDAATHFFSTHEPTKSWTASEWRKHISQHSDSLSDIVPEVVFLGRSNSGKSSLLNALLDSPGLCRVGPRPGKTTTMHAWTLARPKTRKSIAGDYEPKLTVLDMPGYGHGSRSEWGLEIVRYIRRRRQLRRAFVLLNPKHGVKASDEQILQVLRGEGIPHQIVACKCDDLKASEYKAKLEELRETVTRSATEQRALGLVLNDVLAVGNLGDGRANQRVDAEKMRGVENVRWAILQATGLDQYASKQFMERFQSVKDTRPLRIIDSNQVVAKTSSESNSS